MRRAGGRPPLILLMGLPGAGKSTLARGLCRTRGYARVDRDALRAALFAGRRVAAEQKRAANAAVWRKARALLLRRHGVVVDGMTFAAAAERRCGRRLARRCGARCIEVFLQCPETLARARIAADPHHPADDRGPALVGQVARRFDPVSRAALRLDARRSAAAVLRRLLRLARWREL